MTQLYLTQIAFDAARCVTISIVALAIGWPLGSRVPRSRWTVALLLAPILTPALLVSYAYAPIALRITGNPPLLLLAYSGLLTLKLISLAALARWLLPSTIAREALHCERLIEGRSFFTRAGFALRSLGTTPWVILAICFLLAFTDFELASLLSVKDWPVLLFDAHAGGLELKSSLERVLPPLIIEGLLLAGIVFSLRRAPLEQAAALPSQRAAKWPLIVLALIASAAALIPFGTVVVQAASALPTITYTGVMLQEIATSVGFAIAGAGLAWMLAGIARSARFGVLLVLPGLLGGLVLALLVLALFQTPPLRIAYDTPAPLTVALTLLFTPIALLLRWMVQTHQPREAVHLARMAGVRRLLWELSLSRRVAAVGLVFLLAYFELTASALLSPVGFTPAFVRLHNLSHYGQTPILSLMLLAATLAPVLLLALTLGLGRLYARRDAR